MIELDIIAVTYKQSYVIIIVDKLLVATLDNQFLTYIDLLIKGTHWHGAGVGELKSVHGPDISLKSPPVR